MKSLINAPIDIPTRVWRPSQPGAPPGLGLLRRWRHRLTRSLFYRNVAFLAGGTVVGQIIAAGTTPLLTRLFSAREYGALGLYSSVLTIFAAIAMLRYEPAIMVADSDEDAADVLGLSLAAALATALLVAIFSPFLRRFVMAHERSGDFRLIPVFLPLGMLACSLYSALSLWSIRQRRFQKLAKTKVTQAFGMALTQLLGGLAHLGAAGLLLGHVIGQSGGVGLLGRHSWKENGAALRRVSLSGMLRAARRYRRFPIFSTLATLCNTLGDALPALYLAAAFGPASVGYYTVGQRILFLPSTMLAASVSQAYFSEASGLKRRDPAGLLSLFRRRVAHLSAIALPAGVLMTLGIPALIPLLLGARWADAGTCIRILSPVFVAGFIASPFGCTLDLLQRQDLHLVREVTRILLAASAIGTAVLIHASWKQALALLSCAGVLTYLVYLLISWLATYQHGSGRAELLHV